MTPADGLTYRQAGVDIDAGNALVERLKPLVRATRRAGADAEPRAGHHRGGHRIDRPRDGGCRKPAIMSGWRDWRPSNRDRIARSALRPPNIWRSRPQPAREASARLCSCSLRTPRSRLCQPCIAWRCQPAPGSAKRVWPR